MEELSLLDHFVVTVKITLNRYYAFKHLDLNFLAFHYQQHLIRACLESYLVLLQSLDLVWYLSKVMPKRPRQSHRPSYHLLYSR
jgi:hypothetical protein